MRVSHIGAPHLEHTGRTLVIRGLSAKKAIGASALPALLNKNSSDSTQVAPDWVNINYKCFKQKLNSTEWHVHSGSAIVGNFGGGLFRLTAYGGTINVAARLKEARSCCYRPFVGCRLNFQACLKDRHSSDIRRPAPNCQSVSVLTVSSDAS